MKMKNVNFFQQHVEKLVLGAALLIAALLVLIYVIGTPYAAEVGGQTLGPVEIEQRVEELAMQLDARLNATASPLPEMVVPPYTQDFARRVDREVSASHYRVTIGRPGLDPNDVMPPQPPDPYNLPHPPVPTDVLARAGHGVLGAFDNPRQHEAMIELVGDTQPRDFRYVSVSATFNLDEWYDRLLATPALPSQFYRSMIGLTGVYLQRQTFDPTTGQWGDTTIVRPLPTQIAALPQYTYEYTDQEAEQAVRLVEENQQKIARPEFPPLANQAIWLPPWSEFGQLSAEEQREFQSLGERIRTLTARIERLQDRIQRAAESNRPTTANADMAVQLERMQQDLFDAQARRDELIGLPPDMNQTGGPGRMRSDFDGSEFRDTPRAAQPTRPGFSQFPQSPGVDRRPPAPTQAQAESVDDGEITVWAHDLTVEPGKTYRYRVLVSVLNPLFRQTRVEESQRQVHFNKIALGPDMAEEGEVGQAPWSDPVEVDPEYYFFFVQGGQSPRVEVWRVYDGIWRSEEFPVQPGDPIGGEMAIQVNGEPQTIDMNVGAVVVDLLETSGGRGMLSGSDARLLYLDQGSSQIASRSAQQDRDSDDRRRIQNLRTIQEERQRQASATQP